VTPSGAVLGSNQPATCVRSGSLSEAKSGIDASSAGATAIDAQR
jgi:hypothetical protein